MWVEEGGATDATDTTTGASEDLTVHVEGEEYSAEVNFDIDSDGVDDTAVIEHADGSGQAFIDSDADGEADEYLALDAQGEVVAHATYDEASGDWVAVEPADTGGDPDTQASAGGMITADLPDGEVQVGPATVDTDHDGVNDTAVVDTGSGTTMAFTDVDGDGDADVAVSIDARGNATVYEHTGDGEWTESAPPAASGSDSLWGQGYDIVEGVARIDSATGQWISQN